MLRGIRDYSLALAAILATYLLYANTVVRWVEPKLGPPIGMPDRDPPPPLPNPFQHLFQPGDWELNQPKVLLTSQGTLLFLDYQPLENDRLEIRPCTLILYSQDAESEQSGRPIVMRAAEGAVLQFDDDVDLSRAQFGRLIGGRILGDIRVFSPESTPGAGDALELLTRNLQIERLKAWTPHEVKFRYGASRGSGHDLVMTLSPAEQIAGQSKSPAVGAIETVQLSQVDELWLESQQRSLIPGGDEAAKPKEKQPPVKITCDGPLRFDVQKNVVTFDDNVLVQRLTPDAVPDWLRCDQLAVYLDSASKNKPEKDSQPGSIAGDVQRIVAVGKPVVLEAPSQSAHTEAERLEYNLKTRQVQLKSLKSGAVLLRRGTDEFHAPEFAYELAEGKRLGKLWAPGPGNLVSAATGDKGAFGAEWQKEIRIRPDGTNHLISLLGGAKVDGESHGSFAADELHLWVLEEDRKTGFQRVPTSRIGFQPVPKEQNNSGQAGSLSYLRPDRLLAMGHVRADSPQLSADAERLEAWFIQPPGETTPAKPQQPDELSLNPADKPALREPVFRIREPEATRPEKVQHFHVVGQLIQLQLRQQGKQSAVDQITVEGDKVRLREMNAAENELPLSIHGTRLELQGGTSTNCVITVTGGDELPAILSARGLTLRSRQLKFSRRDNRVTVEQAGEMTLPILEDMQGKALPEPRELTITWQGNMLFDGLAAHFRKQVIVRGDTYSAAADDLQAQLTSQIDFSKARAGGPKPAIKRLTMGGGARFENRTYDPIEGRLQSVERMNAESLEVDRISGAIQGAGPGWLTRVQVGSPQGGPAPVGAKPAAKDELTYLRVDFREELKGNLHRRQVDFADQVQAVWGPVPHWEGTIEPNSREALGERGLVLNADKVGVAEFRPPGAKKGTMEMTATGNTRVEGRDYTARAHRLTYTSAKSLLVLEGDGRNDAEIKHQFKNAVSAQKLKFWQDTGDVEIEGGKSITIGPTSSRPMPPRSPRDTIRQR